MLFEKAQSAAPAKEAKDFSVPQNAMAFPNVAHGELPPIWLTYDPDSGESKWEVGTVSAVNLYAEQPSTYGRWGEVL